MSFPKVYTLRCSSEHLLMIFYTDQQSYQFRVVTPEGKLFGTQELYCTAKEAETAARNCLVEHNF